MDDEAIKMLVDNDRSWSPPSACRSMGLFEGTKDCRRRPPDVFRKVAHSIKAAYDAE